MEKENRFTKLLMISADKNESVLLYGFSSATNQEPYIWRQRKVPKTHQSVYIDQGGFFKLCVNLLSGVE